MGTFDSGFTSKGTVCSGFRSWLYFIRTKKCCYLVTLHGVLQGLQTVKGEISGLGDRLFASSSLLKPFQEVKRGY